MKSCLLYLFLILLHTNASAQKTRQDSLNQSKNYLNDKLTFLVLQNFVKDKEKYSDSLNAISSNFQNLTVESAFPYSKLSELLKSAGFDKVNMKLSAPLDELNTQPLIGQPYDKAASALTDSSFAILKKSYSNYYQSAKENKDELVNAITFYIKPPIQQGGGGNPQPTRPDGSHKEAQEAGSSLSLWMVLPFILFIILGVAGFFAWRSITARLKILEKNTPAKTETNASSNQLNDAFLKAPFANSQRNEFDRYFGNNSTIKDFQDAIEKLQTRVGVLENEKTKTGSEIVANKQSSPNNNELKTGETFYMSLPITNYFLDKTKSLSKDNTVYRFILNPGNKQEARFSVHVTGAQLADIVNASESFIKPACDEENRPGSNVKNIRTVQPGLAVLEGDKWMIKNKALIHYD